MHTPLISVIIPCYNHSHYLPEAVESVLGQQHPAVEVIVVDDGSTDRTQEVAARYPQVRYVYQANQGLSAARNTGIRHSSGEYLVFLDADDWLYPGALGTNLRHLQQYPQAAFVSGAYDAIHVKENVVKEYIKEVKSDHYCRLLKEGNYIGMIAAVLFQRWVFDDLLYNENLRSCEDYDLYLRIARKYPVIHHTEKIAAYRIHSSNMSSNVIFMLATVLHVLRQQRMDIRTEVEKQAWKNGQTYLKDLYMSFYYYHLLEKRSPLNKEVFFNFLKYKPSLYIKYFMAMGRPAIRSKISAHTPGYLKRLLKKKIKKDKPVPPLNKIILGDFDRTTPFSMYFGYDRGGPIDRFYIENFLEKEATHIKGRILEIGDNTYSKRYGADRITQSDILHVDNSNEQATFVGDISNAPHLPNNTFDCIILTQTLHLVYNFKEALSTCYRILKPGGTLLLTVPGITPISHDEWEDTWYWSFTDKALLRVMKELFPRSETEINTYGNVLSATAFLYGMGVNEVPREKLNYHDPHYQVIVTVRSIKKV
ncbi:glycosyltransferase [Pontibacter sp. BT731]|uniref:glycosyltransferase n=1 Tax=Pontibacter coccineus TaxID=3063328 RepID=UPI0026E3392B|nr:glycosyltransferase [Pontibacter sp. BT731]MDO6391763.1 glycosyltransferase [Pontibacter sp. BT731]